METPTTLEVLRFEHTLLNRRVAVDSFEVIHVLNHLLFDDADNTEILQDCFTAYLGIHILEIAYNSTIHFQGTDYTARDREFLYNQVHNQLYNARRYSGGSYQSELYLLITEIMDMLGEESSFKIDPLLGNFGGSVHLSDYPFYICLENSYRPLRSILHFQRGSKRPWINNTPLTSMAYSPSMITTVDK